MYVLFRLKKLKEKLKIQSFIQLFFYRRKKSRITYQHVVLELCLQKEIIVSCLLPWAPLIYCSLKCSLVFQRGRLRRALTWPRGSRKQTGKPIGGADIGFVVLPFNDDF